MRTEPKSSVDILEHVTGGGIEVQFVQFARPGGPRRAFESIVAVVETEPFRQTGAVPTRNRFGSSNVLSRNEPDREG